MVPEGFPAGGTGKAGTKCCPQERGYHGHGVHEDHGECRGNGRADENVSESEESTRSKGNSFRYTSNRFSLHFKKKYKISADK